MLEVNIKTMFSMNNTIHIVYDTIQLIYKIIISKSLARRNLSTVNSNTITGASKTMKILLGRKTRCETSASELDGVDLRVSHIHPNRRDMCS